ncbi:BamA/TamA family outer membrane protein [Rhodovulum sulfidophilum]|uniref:BamA/TamA family outer membrane protein n=1 Tax=Rhodovulum sulfidophilum TaxID=35806 RepID=UPI00192385C5|nr:BamA/TamA family outer membrane protein [Rhodovulum sulfidophilum]MBL3560857.1 BamA/TamA family outer membrane protein [Rhodovulum sulfidophilum]
MTTDAPRRLAPLSAMALAVGLLPGAAGADRLVTGVSYSTVYGATAQVDLGFTDILSSGVDLRLGYRGGSEGHGTSLALTRDWEFGDTGLGRDTVLTFGIEGYSRDWDFQSYRRETYTAALSLGAGLTERARYSVGIFAQHDDLEESDDDVSPLILKDLGDSHASGIDLGLTWSNRQKGASFAPGTEARIDLRRAGFGSGRDFSQVSVNAETFLPMGRGTILNLGFDGGLVSSNDGDYVTLLDRATMGGGMLRGFTFDGIGPRDMDTDDALGGTRYLAASAELFVPTPRDNLWLGAFYDIGTLWHLPGLDGADIDDDLYWRQSVGLSMTFETRIGRVNTSLAKPIAEREGDDIQYVSVSLSTTF